MLGVGCHLLVVAGVLLAPVGVGPASRAGGARARPARWASRGVDTGALLVAERLYGYRGTIVGEGSHPGLVPPPADLSGATAPREVLRYMRLTAGAGPGV